jgi:DNA-binding transcriptional LysR family regulator
LSEIETRGRDDTTALARGVPRRRRAGSPTRQEMTLQQIRIFWAVAHSETLTRAAKQLGLTQPSLSQQLSKLETKVGTPLFRRTPLQMELTDAGRFLLRKAEQILTSVEEAQNGMHAFSAGTRLSLRVAGLNSVLRVLLPPALRIMQARFPEMDLDIHEVAPAEALELLYGRRVNIGLLAANSIAEANVSFHGEHVAEDPYVLAVPAGLALTGVQDPDSELDHAERSVLNSCIQFSFGTQHTRRVEAWYRQVLPRHRLVASCRNYEVALALVQAGLGVCLVPAFTILSGGQELGGLTLYRASGQNRRIVALMPAQYQHLESHSKFVLALRTAGSEICLPRMTEAPPFLEHVETGF